MSFGASKHLAIAATGYAGCVLVTLIAICLAVFGQHTAALTLGVYLAAPLYGLGLGAHLTLPGQAE